MKLNKIIAVDMDGVFCDFVGGLYTLAAELYPEIIHHLPDRNTQKNFYIDDDVEDPLTKNIVAELCNHPRLFPMLPPFEGALEGMKRLQAKAAQVGFDVMICTAPHKENKQSYSAKAQWIEDHLGFEWLNKTLIVRDKTVINATLLLDDKPEPLGDYKPIWEHVIMDQPYNRIYTHKARFRSWSDDGIEGLLNYAVRRHAFA